MAEGEGVDRHLRRGRQSASQLISQPAYQPASLSASQLISQPAYQPASFSVSACVSSGVK